MPDFAPVDPAAEWVTTERKKIALSAEDWDLFYNGLTNPPEPNENLKAAARRYRERLKAGHYHSQIRPMAIKPRPAPEMSLRTYQEHTIRLYQNEELRTGHR